MLLVFIFMEACCARLRMCVHFSVIFSCTNKFRCELSESPTCTFGRKLRKVIIFKGIRATVPYFPLNVIEINRIFLVKMKLLWLVLSRLEMVNLIWIDFLNGLWGDCLLYLFFFLSNTGYLLGLKKDGPFIWIKLSFNRIYKY